MGPQFGSIPIVRPAKSQETKGQKQRLITGFFAVIIQSSRVDSGRTLRRSKGLRFPVSSGDRGQTSTNGYRGFLGTPVGTQQTAMPVGKRRGSACIFCRNGPIALPKDFLRDRQVWQRPQKHAGYANCISGALRFGALTVGC